jgi:hypothetical protein
MGTAKFSSQVGRVVQEIDRLIAEMTTLRRRVSALGSQPVRPDRSVREAEYFGMWADRTVDAPMTEKLPNTVVLIGFLKLT